ncbi:pyruvate dehydrogenase (acetyl-transferring) E1 component subunit alpha [Bacillus fonticola]|uniref:pyruvate dehydrogenase (acetyl-transferring) E1 component subunit alpha n=1 Tax=Bacillus fonticola TaxID=2728853 RepID=UPI001474C26D|nr:pyruvate dehydrogenase (acetyl-transferring) E1 component subunit alpha [Bacillus fonticola]
MEEKFPIQQWVSNEGTLRDDSLKDSITKSFMQTAYTHLQRVRAFDQKAIRLQRQGRLGTYAPFEGQEAAQVGSALALGEGDWLFPTYRDHAATLTFGHSMPHVFLYWNGRVEGCVPPKGKHIMPPAVPIATQIPHATGAAMAEQRKGTDRLALVYFGDGATSEGDFHEGLNFASVFQAPVVFFNQNNGYAISVPIEKQMRTKTIAQKGLAYDIPSVRVDGSDVLAVYAETKKAVERARSGGGPTLIEAVTWRFGAHTTADDPTKYRNQEESLAKREAVDPIVRFEKFMKNYDFWDESLAKQIVEEAEEEVNRAVEEMESFPKASLPDLFDHVYANPPAAIEKQKRYALGTSGGEIV